MRRSRGQQNCLRHCQSMAGSVGWHSSLLDSAEVLLPLSLLLSVVISSKLPPSVGIECVALIGRVREAGAQSGAGDRP